MRAQFLKPFSIAAALSITASGFCSYDGLVDSVHFYYSTSAGQDFTDFNRAPQFAMIPNANNEMVRAGGFYGGRNYNDMPYSHISGLGEHESDDERERAHHLEISGKHQQALKIYERWADKKADQAFVAERRALFEMRHRIPPAKFRKYLGIRYEQMYGRQSEGTEALMNFEPDDLLRPYVAYEKACATQGSRETKVAAFQKIIERFPQHVVAKKSKLMQVQALIGEAHERDTPPPTMIDQADGLLADLINSTDREMRWRAEAWRARSLYLKGKLDTALSIYHRQFGEATTALEKDAALRSIGTVLNKQGLKHLQFCAELRRLHIADNYNIRFATGDALNMLIGRMDAASLERLREKVSRDDALLSAYLTYRIEFSRMKGDDEKELAQFALESLKNIPRPSAALRVRIAQILYNSGQYPAAKQQSQRVLAGSGSVEDRARASYILAASEYRLGHFKSAERGYLRVAESSAPRYLRTSATEALALLQERHLRPEDALKSYIKLGYWRDTAYLADIKMTPAQLAQFTREYRGADRNVFLYTLGLRYMRIEDYDRAESAFRRIPKADRLRFGMKKADYDAAIKDFKDWSFDRMPQYGDPIDVVLKLRSFDQQKRAAKTSDAKAAAIYAKAAYIYKERNLLFYSFGLWRDSRAFSMSIFWSDWVNNADDDRAVEKHNNEHECLAHVMRLCEEVVLNHRSAQVRPKALYTGAVAMEKLTDAFPNWRDKRPKLLPKAIHWLDALEKQYPHHELTKPAAKFRGVFEESNQSRFYE